MYGLADSTLRGEDFTSLYEPIYNKIRYWIEYELGRPKSNYYLYNEEHDLYRSNNDLDCVLRNGDLFADTIFSLWMPLRFSLVRQSGYSKIKMVSGFQLDKTNIDFLKSLIFDRNLEKLLPRDNETKGDANNIVYLGIKNGETVYTGITKQPLNSRLGQHIRSGKDIDYLEPIYEGVTRNQARAYEQNLLENPIGNSNKLNKINSVSPKNKYHDDAVNWAQKNR